jgi:hypothetical protein
MTTPKDSPTTTEFAPNTDAYITTGTENSTLYPHYIVIYSLFFLICSFIILGIVFAHRFYKSVLKRFYRYENPIFTGSIPQQKLNLIERRLFNLENPTSAHASNDNLIPLKKSKSKSNRLELGFV